MGAVQNLADQTRQWWAEKPARDAEWALWANVPDLAHLRELVAWFCEGKLSFTPGHHGPRCTETEGHVGDALAHANRSGFLTVNSQNPHDDEQRADVMGLADDATVARLRGLVDGTRLRMQAAPLRFFPQEGTVPGSDKKPDGTAYKGNPVMSWPHIARDFYGIPDEVLSQVTHLNYVQIVDPKWGPADLLWRRLSAPDWDNPPPPDEDRAMPAHIPAGREDLWRRQAEADAEVRRLSDLYSAAEQQAERMSRITAGHDPRLRALDTETERINTELDRAEAVAERVHQERTAGLSGWIDHDPTAPICPDCKGAGGPPGHDAHGACRTCRGWGREYREPIPVWSEQAGEWINPATGQTVDILATPDKPTEPATPSAPPARQNTAAATTSSSGASMSSAVSYGSLKARILNISTNLTDAQGPQQQLLQCVEDQIAELTATSEDSNHAGIQEALACLMSAKQSIEEAGWMIGAAQASTEGAAAELS